MWVAERLWWLHDNAEIFNRWGCFIAFGRKKMLAEWGEKEAKL